MSLIEEEEAAQPDVAASPEVLLRVENLSVDFQSERGHIYAVRNLNFTLRAGEVLAVLGESGSGQSGTSRALMGHSDGCQGLSGLADPRLYGRLTAHGDSPRPREVLIQGRPSRGGTPHE